MTTSIPLSDFVIALDLDETLVHSYFRNNTNSLHFDVLLRRCEIDHKHFDQLEQRNYFYSPATSESDKDYVIHLRPGVRVFLQRLFEKYRIGIWSAGSKTYVDYVCSILFPSAGTMRPEFVWNEQQCTFESSFFSQTRMSKPVDSLAKMLHLSELKVILVDNRKENAFYFPEYFVLVEDWEPHALQIITHKEYRRQKTYLLETCMMHIDLCVLKVEKIFSDRPDDLFGMSTYLSETQSCLKDVFSRMVEGDVLYTW